MSQAAESVIYLTPPARLDTVSARVERQSPDTLDLDTAADVISLLAESYRVQFEERATGRFHLPAGTIHDHFRPTSTERQRGHYDRMVGAMDTGSQYWTIRADRNLALQDLSDDPALEEGRVIALAKVTPWRKPPATRDDLYDESPANCYVNDLLVHPAVQRKGLGATALHAALIAGGFNPEGQVLLDGFIGNHGPNRMFARRLGLRRVLDVKVSPMPVGFDRRLQQVRYVTPEDLTVQGVVARLESRKQWLSTGIPLGHTV